jgi:excisionase family DNA binding protein
MDRSAPTCEAGAQRSERDPVALPHDYDPPPPLSTRLLRAEEVADLLSVKPSTIYELSRRRHDPLPSVRIGRSKRFERSAVARWVAEHATR